MMSFKQDINQALYFYFFRLTGIRSMPYPLYKCEFEKKKIVLKFDG